MTDPKEESRATDRLVARAQQGDTRAFEDLVRLYYDRIYRWVLLILRDPDEADDAAQEVLLLMHRRLGDYDGRSQFSTWLYRVARNTALSMERKRMRRRRLKRTADPRPASVDPDYSPERISGLVRTLMWGLPERQRTVFNLADLQGYRPREIGEMLNLNPVTVRAHLLRARRRIRSEILGRYPEFVGADEP